MEIEKTLTVAAAPQRVWELLLDPSVMGSCVPGMQSIDVLSPTEYVALMHVKIAFVSAKFKLRTTIVEQREPTYLRAEGTGEDASVASSLKQHSEIFLTPADGGGTELRIKVNVDVLGRLGTFGLSVMKTKADRMWEEFGNKLRARIDGTEAPDAAAAPIAAVAQAVKTTPPSALPTAKPERAAQAPLEPLAPAPSMAPAATQGWWSRLRGNGRTATSGSLIHIEIRQAGKTIRVDWPLEGADQCQAWLRTMASG